jgi:NhaP-type Na+/H+ or K+/H+ antiporter
VLEEAGLIAATVMGVVLGNMNLPSIGEIRRFKEYIAVLLVSGVFLLLTADLDPRILLALDWRSGALIAASSCWCVRWRSGSPPSVPA